jgi:hypothetical protein
VEIGKNRERRHSRTAPDVRIVFAGTDVPEFHQDIVATECDLPGLLLFACALISLTLQKINTRLDCRIRLPPSRSRPTDFALSLRLAPFCARCKERGESFFHGMRESPRTRRCDHRALRVPDTMRRSAQTSRSGLRHRKRTYFPNLMCGIGSAERARTWSRTHDTGSDQRVASSTESINS